MIRLHVNVGRHRAGASIAEDQIDPKHLAQLLRDKLAEPVEVVVVADGPFDQAMASYAAALDAVGQHLVVILDLVEAGGDAEAIAFVDLMREHQTSTFAQALNERLGPLMARALDASERQPAEWSSTAPGAAFQAPDATVDGPLQGAGAGLALSIETPPAAAAPPVAATNPPEGGKDGGGEQAAPAETAAPKPAKSAKPAKAKTEGDDAPAEA